MKPFTCTKDGRFITENKILLKGIKAIKQLFNYFEIVYREVTSCRLRSIYIL